MEKVRRAVTRSRIDARDFWRICRTVVVGRYDDDDDDESELQTRNLFLPLSLALSLRRAPCTRVALYDAFSYVTTRTHSPTDGRTDGRTRTTRKIRTRRSHPWDEASSPIRQLTHSREPRFKQPKIIRPLQEKSPSGR